MNHIKLKNILKFIIVSIFLLLINNQTAFAIEQYYFNLGNIQKKSNMCQVISLTNKYKNPLLINNISAECGCINATILTSKGVKISAHGQEATIQPMTYFNIAIVLKTSKLQGLMDKRLYLKGIRNNRSILFLIHIKGNVN